MRDRHHRGAPRARETPYPARRFGSYFGELVDAQDQSLRSLSRAAGVNQSTLSGYRHGRYLPQSVEAIEKLVEILAPTKASRAGVRRELVHRWRADLLEAQLRAWGWTVAEARKALEDL